MRSRTPGTAKAGLTPALGVMPGGPSGTVAQPTESANGNVSNTERRRTKTAIRTSLDPENCERPVGRGPA
ncbi:hypothetical protein MoryE10_23130 [Methylogaea oryzae]|uniref:Uncharacterized protein n=1 Tax=Methylogaea oryzae TaxID=1295382 RepID=A0A8D4VQ70_9GAMM|nr:hypothetical protein MoryE10_23130 [Methylogaea oryzae]